MVWSTVRSWQSTCRRRRSSERRPPWQQQRVGAAPRPGPSRQPRPPGDSIAHARTAGRRKMYVICMP